jgi:hypothetical protein
MPNIEHVYLFYSELEEIPDNAFNGTHNNLTQIILYGNKITKVGNNAFSQCIQFFNSSENYLDLFLNNCLLNSSSFEKKAFSNLKRPTILRFNFGGSSNKTFLDQHIFEEFLNNNDRNGIELYTIDCKDCRSFWLFSDQKYSDRIGLTQLRCSDGKKFTDKTNFAYCIKV